MNTKERIFPRSLFYIYFKEGIVTILKDRELLFDNNSAVYVTTAMSDPSRVCHLYLSSQQHWIFKPVAMHVLSPNPLNFRLFFFFFFFFFLLSHNRNSPIYFRLYFMCNGDILNCGNKICV